MPKDDYEEYLVETYESDGEPSNATVRVRPIGGQGLPINLRVRCSRDFRTEFKIGTIFKIRAKLTDREGGSPFLHSPYTWPYEVLSSSEADKYLSRTR